MWVWRVHLRNDACVAYLLIHTFQFLVVLLSVAALFDALCCLVYLQSCCIWKGLWVFNCQDVSIQSVFWPNLQGLCSPSALFCAPSFPNYPHLFHIYVLVQLCPLCWNIVRFTSCLFRSLWESHWFETFFQVVKVLVVLQRCRYCFLNQIDWLQKQSSKNMIIRIVRTVFCPYALAHNQRNEWRQ